MFIGPLYCLFRASFSLSHLILMPSFFFHRYRSLHLQKAGKTTLVNYILKEQNEWKIAVLENEFGEVSC